MTPVTTCAGKRLALFGLGGSGLVTAQALVAGGASVLAWDDASAARTKAAELGLAVVDLHDIDWRGVDALVLTPGVPLTHPQPHWAAALAMAASVEIIGDIELFCRERARVAPGAPFVAITGTNGKSTTTALTAHILREAGRDVALGGNIGTAILALPPPAPGRVHVIEVSSYQIDLAPSLDPTIGVLTNLTPDHIDRHGTMENYAAVKERLTRGADFSLVSVDDPHSAAVFERAMEIEQAAHSTGRKGGRQYPVSVRKPLPTGILLEGSWIAFRPYEGEEHGLAHIDGLGRLRGMHNVQNACFAAGVATLLGVTPAQIQRGLKTFPGLAHRMEEVGHKDGVLFINDSKATNADSTEKALLSFRRVFWILGGVPKAGGIAELKRFFPMVEHAYLIGQATEDFAATLGSCVALTRCGTLEVATRSAFADARASPTEDKVVLFSPACASFDQFRNFEERGDRFRALVQTLDG
ncbi:MAG TPA: UDP-N-acetylmuramoyl-L-alanine--D-glutamate ligase [Lichenihabitans sp.]|jgi:UDP-N-acetylmuramoylalanine--D-glutamate ligase|nr:UDP-N-acetylmuramoyl-L-alanine--D-glutamate ligase [Lichenihabitans sp.]